MAFNKELLDILVDPVSKQPLTLTPEEDGLICEATGMVYPIRDEIPVMLPEEAIPLVDWKAGKRQATSA
ncbi:MAG: Trm112 family protein [Desulfovibrio sp.]|nr:Trm112 family protein [Desulfovibrio sp.]MCA1986377.1 Trm112 family protein [Desulfovibrio sp.]